MSDSGEVDLERDDDPRSLLLGAPMGAYRITALAVTIALCALDGFDVLAITFAAPAIVREWGVGKLALGSALSAGLFGMAAGSLLIAPAADRFGRRPLIFISLTLMCAATLWTAFAQDVTGLTLSRFVTGLGIGAMIAVINPLAAEHSNARRRDLALSLLNIGYPIGGVLGGFVAAYLLHLSNWRAIFITAAALAAVMAVASWRFLPESVPYLLANSRAGALDRVNIYLERCGLPPVASLPACDRQPALPLFALFRGGAAAVTLKITLIYFLYVVSLFYIQSWLPALVAMAGFSPAQGALASVCLNLGGIAGGIVIGAASARVGLKQIVVAAFFLGAGSIALFGVLPASFSAIIAGSALLGLTLFGGMIGLYAVVARTFPAHMRASGTGFAIGIGRFGAALAPLLAALLFKMGLGREGVSLAMAAPAVAAALLLLTFRVKPPTTA